MRVIALDIGGSSVKSGAVVDGHPDGEVVVTPLDHTASATALVGAFAAAIRSVASEPERVAAAVPDPFDHAKGVSLMRHKFAALCGQPLAPLVEAELGCHLEMRWCNDAAAAVVGEALEGAGKGSQSVLGVTLGTGLGAALVRRGRLVPQVGDTVVGDLWRATLPDGRQADHAFSARALRTLEGTATDAFGTDLGQLLAPIVRAAGVDVVVVGGGGAGSFDAIAESLRATLGVRVEPAQLGRWSPLIGAIHLCYGNRVPDRPHRPTAAPGD